MESIRAAKAIKPALGWERYVLCVNVAISGKAEATLKTELPDIEILPNSHWVQMCENYPTEVERNFRKLIEIPAPRIQAAIEERFISAYSDEMKRKLDSCQIDIILYCNQLDTTYRVSVSEDFTCEELLEVFRAFFKLPESKTVEAEEIRVSLSHSVVFEGKQVPLSKTLRDAGILAGSVVTYWTTFRWKDLHHETRGDVIQMMTMQRITASSGVRSKSERSGVALRLFKILVCSQFEQVDASLVGNV